jgi:nitrate/TMAO reductase-like tetraheme cytochrome c subunit
MEQPKFPRLAYNTISAAGATMAAIMGLIADIMLAINVTMEQTNAYFGIFLYMVLPAVLVFGLLLIPVGMYREYRRWQRGEGGKAPKWPMVDLNNRAHRNATIIFLSGTAVFVIMSSVGSYQAYHYTESVTFCGTTCHTVMEPEHTAYMQSPHAHVSCTECHVGYGAGWYAKSKLSGSYQVYAVLTDVYPRPIPTPINNLRPARETCEECHWPEKTYGVEQRQFTHFLYDSANSRWSMNMLIKTDTGEPGQGQRAGIHWHINKDIKVEYIARDEKRQDVPWVRVTDKKSGKVTIYQDSATPLEAAAIEQAPKRTMDCIDCHNRPSHVYHAPDYAIDRGIEGGQIDRSLPYIKRIAVEAMAAEYGTKDSAFAGIESKIRGVYQDAGGEFFAANQTKIDLAVAGTRQAYGDNIFPVMKARWSAYPNNVGHFFYKGCMRCHDGNHQSDSGVKISHECNACHTIMAQGVDGAVERDTTGAGLEFKHPIDIDEAWKETGCFECHSGVQP